MTATDHWAETSLGSICEFINGRAFKPSEWGKDGKPIIRIQNLNNVSASYNHFDGFVDPRHQVADGDLLFAWSGTPGTSFGAHIWTGAPAVLNQHIFRVVFDQSKLDPRFLKLAINQTLEELIGQAHGGVGLRHITKSVLLKTKVRIAPLDEQVRIAEVVANAETKIAATAVSLDSALRAVEQYRGACLDIAFGDGDGTAANKRAYRLLGDLVDEGPVNGWSPKTGPDATGALTLKLSATTSGSLRLDDATVKRVYEIPPENSRFWLRSGDLLVQRANSLEYLGAAAIFDGPTSTYIYPDLMMRLRIADPVLREYLWRYLNSPSARRYIRSNATGTSGSMPKISGSTLRALPVPLPHKADYKSVVEFVDKTMTVVEAVKRQIGVAATTLGGIRPSIIDRAFKGTLFPSDAQRSTPVDLRELLTTAKKEKHRPIKSAAAAPRPSAPRSSKGPRNEQMAEQRRVDVSSNHLQTTILTLGGTPTAKEVWRESGLMIDEFYKQLRQEISLGQVAVGKSPELLVANHAH
ncbi:type I restriction enzyme S subunit [Sphingomonas faeni]|uniref:Type I restriction enzyme S subunit n=1 Tax=Sphingomonas faeni TaxID=185950 RepID=A0A2T5TWU5_9SPHN|nr:restriction endonuclease subunit S [Sphingomonas faeni]PTW43703.1 type I restriction enzyme S subunit [Sphingomonas faeni]